MYEIRLLGEQAVSDARGAPLAVPPRAVALVGYLALHAGLPQQRGRIATLFWPDSTDEQALTNLRRELHHLRTALPDGSGLVVTGRELCWRDTAGVRVDLREFVLGDDAARAAGRRGDDEQVVQRGTAALDAYRGDLLPGGWDDWLLEARTELETRAVALCELLGDALARTGDTAGAVEVARRHVRLRPLDEVGYRRLIALQGELGDRAGAVSTYHHCAATLERELGVTPAPATRALLDRLLARDDPPVPRSPTPGGGRSGAAPGTLVGRAQELETVRARWRAAAAGRPSALVVRGDPGVGKTRLVAELAEAARLDGASSRAPSASVPPAASPWPRSRNGCGPSRSARPGRRSTRSGGSRSNDWCPRARRGPRVPGDRWSRRGSATASSRAWPARSSGPGDRRCSCSTTCTGATPRPSPSSPSPSAWSPTPPSWSRRRCAPTPPSTSRRSAPGSAACARPGRSPSWRWAPRGRRQCPARGRGLRRRGLRRGRRGAAGEHRRLPPVRRRGGPPDAREQQPGPGRGPRDGAAGAARAPRARRPRDRRARGGHRPRLQPRSGHRGERPGRRHRRPGRGRAVAPAHPHRGRRGLRLLARPGP